MRRAAACLAAAFLLPAQGSRYDANLQPGERERLALFNGCRPVLLLLRPLGSAAQGLGLARQALLSAAEARLGAARIHVAAQAGADRTTDGAVLIGDVHVAGGAFTVRLQHMKIAMGAGGLSGHAATWEAGILGTHGGEADYISAAFLPLVDKFAAEYLRVNVGACPASRRR